MLRSREQLRFGKLSYSFSADLNEMVDIEAFTGPDEKNYTLYQHVALLRHFERIRRAVLALPRQEEVYHGIAALMVFDTLSPWPRASLKPDERAPRDLDAYERWTRDIDEHGQHQAALVVEAALALGTVLDPLESVSEEGRIGETDLWVVLAVEMTCRK